MMTNTTAHRTQQPLTNVILASVGEALMLTIVTGSRVTSLAGSSPAFSLAVGLSMLATVVVCLCVGILSTRCPDSFKRPLFISFVCIGISGAAILRLAPLEYIFLGCLLIGVSLGCGYLVWGEVFTHFDRNNIILIALISTAIWGLLSSPLTVLDNYQMRMSIICFILVVDAVCYGVLAKLLKRNNECGDGKANGNCKESPFAVRSAGDCLIVKKESSSFGEGSLVREVLFIIWQPLALVCVSGFSSGILRVVNANDNLDPLLLSGIRFLCVVIILLLFFVVWRNKYWFEQRSITLTLLIIAASALLLLPIVEQQYRPVISLIIDIVYLLAGTFLLVACSLTGRNIPAASMLAPSLGQGISIFFIMCGFGLSTFIVVGEMSSDSSMWILALVAIYAIVLVLLLLNWPRSKGFQEESRVSVLDASETQVPFSLISKRDESGAEMPSSVPATRERNVVNLTLSVPESDLRTNKTLVDVYRITQREMDVLILTLSGRNAAGIAQILFVSEQTVRTHLKHIYKKLNIHSKEELHRLIEDVLL